MSQPTGEDILDMSDEDFAKASPSTLIDAGEPQGSSEVVSDDGAADEDTAPDAAAVAADAAAEDEGGDDQKADDKADEDKQDDPAADKDGDKDAEAAKDGEGKEKAKDAPKEEAKPDTTKVANPTAEAVIQPARAGKDVPHDELIAFYDQVLKPLKANGREIPIRSPEEAIRLMQMGAGYGRKLQEIQPALKSLRMLEKNNLLDDSKLSFLIELDKKNPEAIKKLIKDSGIDPLDLNMDDNADYRPTDHSVSDNEVAFGDALKTLQSQPGGRETIQHINETWDKKSKEFLWDNPAVLASIQEQRQNGIYAVITAELENQKILGKIPYNTPFLEAYKIAGDALVEANQLNRQGGSGAGTVKNDPAPAVAQAGGGQQDSRVLATRVATPKSQVSNGDKAKAAASTKTTPRKAAVTVNPLDMADDEFLKQRPY